MLPIRQHSRPTASRFSLAILVAVILLTINSDADLYSGDKDAPNEREAKPSAENQRDPALIERQEKAVLKLRESGLRVQRMFRLNGAVSHG